MGQLTEDVKEFHRSRIAFGFIRGRLEVLVHDERDHRQWFKDDFKIEDHSEFEPIVRGYILNDRICLYKGSEFLMVDEDEITTNQIHQLLNLAKVGSSTPRDKYYVYSGAVPGPIGAIWHPQHLLFTVDNFGNIDLPEESE